MKIALLSAPYLKEYMRNARCDFVSLSATQWYPILLGYCGAYLEGKGHEVKLIDAPSQYLDHDATRKVLFDFKPELVVLYTGHMSETNDIDFMESVVEKIHCDVVIAGPFASIDPENTLSKTKTINKLISGEFEYPVEEIARGLKPQDIKNLTYKENGKIYKNEQRPYLSQEQLNAIPFVSTFFWKHLNIYDYKTPSELYPYMDIMTGRGCKWGLCTYCLWVHTFVKGKTYNVRTVENVIEEFRNIKENIPEIKSVMIQDDTFTNDRAKEFSEKLIASGIKLPWSCYSRADLELETLKLMKKAGCRVLHVGYESADPQVLIAIKKGLTVEKMTKFTKDAKTAGVKIHGDFALGFPLETSEKAKKTIDWAYDMNPDTAQFQIMIPFPGTPYHKYMAENGWLNKNGQPDMPQFTNEQIRETAKKAYRKFYLSYKYLWKAICNPNEYFFGKFKTILRAIPAMFWQKWKV